MSTERYVVLGLARPRAHWFSDITRWATSATLPLEFVKCLSVDEARARLASGRRWSAVLVDAAVPGVDRDLLDAAAGVGAVVLVISDPRVGRDWLALGARATLQPALSPESLLSALAEHARPVQRSTPTIEAPDTTTPPPWRGRLVAVTGTGGVGTSTVAAMMAQGFGSDVTEGGLVVLADLALDADQAVIHDPGDVVPGLPELVEAHRLGSPDPDEIRALTYAIDSRGHHLLLGLRRHRDWVALRPRAVASALEGLRRAYRVVVADVDPDLEGDGETGSTDVEDRNVLARSTIPEADVVVIVGTPGQVGTHRLARLARTLAGSGVDPTRLLPAVNHAPRSPRRRSEITSALGTLAGLDELASPIFLGHRRAIDDIVSAGGRWPEAAVRVLHGSVLGMLQRQQPVVSAPAPEPERVVPGSLGHYADLDGTDR